MNLYQHNIATDPKVLRNAQFDIGRYIDFITTSIDFLKKETFAIKVTTEKGNNENRYTPSDPESKKTEKAIELLFNENTKVVFDQKTDFRSENGITVIRQVQDENYVTLSKEITGNTIYLKPDTNQLEQQKRALNNLRYRPLREHRPLLELFGFPGSHFWAQDHDPENLDWQILTDSTKDGTEEQREFVLKALQTKDFALLEGPPGSGKTTTIIELIMQLAREGKRILLCSATHAAIDNVIERIKGRYKTTCDKEIIPVRICNTRQHKSVKETVKPYLLQNLVATYKQEIKNHLQTNCPLESQKYLLQNLEPGQQDTDPIEQIILDSANLVAGTMVGILQHPDIKSNKLGAGFDVLIVDEASKVTFPDFVIPALHARKWVLVGDIRQLSPYVEDDYVSENISGLLDTETQKTLANQFELKIKLRDARFDDCLKVYFTDQNPEVEKQSLTHPDLIIETVSEHRKLSEEDFLKLNSADIIISKDTLQLKQQLSESICVKSVFFIDDLPDLKQQYRQNYHRREQRKPTQYIFDNRREEWSEMVASLLSQKFSFRNTTRFENIDTELDYLVPISIREELDQIKRLAFPSILEMLQTGIGKGNGQRGNRVLTDGFHPYYKKSRFLSLTYQHRMHPDIALTSKDYFYEHNLESATTVLADRNWKYAPNEPTVKWVHNNDATGNKKGNKIINPTEARDMETELTRFLDWAKNNPRTDGEPYEVAVLTFYLNQETELRKLIRRLTKQNYFSKFHKHNTNIFLYTVDKFQGQEADLVLLGFTKFTPGAHFNSPNRLNVALTRARHKLVLFGNRGWCKEKAKLPAINFLATHFESPMRYEL